MITNIDMRRSAFSKFEKDQCKVKTPRYIMNNINVDVILASHCHHVPQVGIPQIAPENKPINVIIAPIGAADFIKYAANSVSYTHLTLPTSDLV